MSDASTAPQDGTAYVTVTIDPDPGFTLVFDGMTATEELGRPFLIELNLSSGKASGNIKSTLGSSVTITMTDANSNKTYFNGILTRASFTGLSGGVYRYHVELRPWIWLLTRTSDCRSSRTNPPGTSSTPSSRPRNSARSRISGRIRPAARCWNIACSTAKPPSTSSPG